MGGFSRKSIDGFLDDWYLPLTTAGHPEAVIVADLVAGRVQEVMALLGGPSQPDSELWRACLGRSASGLVMLDVRGTNVRLAVRNAFFAGSFPMHHLEPIAPRHQDARLVEPD